MHGEEGSAGSFRELDEILPAVGIVPHFPHDALHLLVVHEAVKTFHTVAFDEGNHIVFYGGEVVRNGRHRENSLKTALYAVPTVGANAGRSMGSGRRHRGGEHAVELFRVEIELNFDLTGGWARGIFEVPGECVSVSCTAIQVHRHVANFAASDDAGIEPCGSCNFIPHDVGSGCQHGELGNVVGQGRAGRIDLFDQRRGEMSFDGNVSGSADNLLTAALVKQIDA